VLFLYRARASQHYFAPISAVRILGLLLLRGLTIVLFLGSRVALIAPAFSRVIVPAATTRFKGEF
jgi:hypothetical protein